MEAVKNNRIPSATNQEPETNDILRKEDQNESNVALAAKNTIVGSPSYNNALSSNYQCPSILQWPFTTSTAVELPSSSSGLCVSMQSQPSVAVSQWHQLPHLQVNPTSNQIHQGSPLPHLSHSTTPLWGYHFPGVNAPSIFQPFAPFGMTGVRWQVPGLIGGGASLKEYPLVPNVCYPAGYPYPSCPGTWDPSSEAYRSSLQLPTVSGCSMASQGQSFERGVIKTPAKLSQKHQQLWGAQSAENVQLWSEVCQLKSEVAKYKAQITKLEAEVQSLKQVVEEPHSRVIATNPSRQASKRGRLKRSVASASPDEYKPGTRGRKSTQSKAQSEFKSTLSGKPCNNTSSSQQAGIITNNSNAVGVDGNNQIIPSFHNQVQQQMPELQVCGVGNKEALASCLGPRHDESLAWPPTISPEECGGNASNMACQGFNGAMRHAGKVIPGWSFVNEVDASEELEDTVVSSPKDGNEEMGDDDSSGGEEIARTQQGKGLPQFDNW